MTARELIIALTRVDPDTRIEVYREEIATDHDPNPAAPAILPIVGVDPYESATVLVIDNG